MAEEKKQGGAANFINGPGKGMHTDTSPAAQPENSYRWALNAINSSEDGDLGFLVNEEGNYSCGDIGADWGIIGHVYISDDEAVIFLAPVDGTTSSSLYGWGRLAYVKKNCTVVNLITTNCLNFKITKQIQAIFRIRNGCERNIYWTDNFNDIRHINLDSLEDYLSEGKEEFIANNPTTYMDIVVDPADNKNLWDCETMKLWPDFDYPCIEFIELNEGGSLAAGVYQFAVQYLDQDYNPTNWTDLTQPIPVYESPINATANGIKGADPGTVNEDASSATGFTVDGNATNKAITLKFSNLDTSFQFLRIAVLPSTAGIGSSVEGGRLVAEIPVTSTEEFFTFSEYNPEVTEFLSLDALTVDRKIFNKAKTIEQIDGRLLLGNLEEIELDHAAFQRSANNMQVTYTTRTLDATHADKENVQSGKYYFDYRSYMRDEIYAFGIVWYFKDGTKSPVYHIPGREKNKNAAGAALISAGDYNRPGQTGYTMGQHNRAAASTGWDTTVIVANADVDSSLDMNIQHYENNTVSSNGDILRWEVYNTAVRTSQAFIGGGTYVTKGEMGYYETRDYRYPATRDCKGVPVYPHTGTGTDADPYVMDYVRHHRMPDTTLEPHFYGDPKLGRMQTTQGCKPNAGTNGENPTLRDFASNSVHGDNPFSNTSDQEPVIVTLGIEVSNITPPADIAHRIQGYKIVRAVQNDVDKTVLDKGLVYNTVIAATQWMGRKKAEDGQIRPSECAYQFQANCFNKHMYASACVHMTHRLHGSGFGLNWVPVPSDGIESSEFNSTPSSFLGIGEDGSTTILADDYYCMEFGSKGFLHNGWVLNEDALNTQGTGPHNSGLDCQNCGDGEPKNQNLMAPATVSHGFHWLNTDFQGKDFLSRRGNGYPIPWWGHGRNNHDDMNSNMAVDAGINVGYYYDSIAYPNAIQAYHGPMAKFKEITNAQYVKVERILIGYNYMIYTNNACCGNDMGQDALSIPDTSIFYGTMTAGSGVLNIDRNDSPNKAGATYLYQRMSYQQSVVPYSRVDTGFEANFDQGDDGHWNHCEHEQAGTIDPIWLRDDLYNYSLTNLRLDDSKKISEFQVDSHFPTLGDIPFRNYSQMEFMFMICRTRPGAGKRPYAWPWPGTNIEATTCPIDTAYTDLNEGDLDGLGTAYYVSLKKNSYNAYGAINNLTYNPTHNCVILIDKNLPLNTTASGEVYGGNIFISRLAFKQQQEGGRCGAEVYNSENDKCPTKTQYTVPYSALEGGANNVYEKKWGFGSEGHSYRWGNFRNIVWYWTESEINCELRLGRDNATERIYPYHFESAGSGYGTISFVDNTLAADAGAAFLESDRGNPIPNYYALNEDYHKINIENIYKPLAPQFDFCADCQEKHPYRLAWSEKSFQEEQKDLYKSFLVNNYRDFPAHRGEIWNMWILNNAAFIHTAESLWRIDPSRQLVNPADGESGIHIGTGAFFSNDPREILQSETGYLGSQSQWATMKIESGVIWPDERQGHVFQMQEGPKDLSNIGMKNWMEKNMNIEIYDQYESIYGVKFPFFDNPANPSGAGYVAGYDARYNRYLMTKRDYKLVSPWDTTDSTSPYYQVISADPYSGSWVVSGGNGANCNCVANPLWSSYTNYAVTSQINGTTGELECIHTWNDSVSQTVTSTTFPQSDIWVFYDATSMKHEVAIAAHDAIETWIAANNSPGGVLENWAGQVFHIPMTGERWIEWPKWAMGDNLIGYNNQVSNYFASLPGGFSDVLPPTGYVSDNAVCLVLADEASSEYHGDYNSGNYSSSEKTAAFNTARTGYVTKYDAHIAAGKTCKSLLYPVCTNMETVKEMFLLHAFSAMYGSGISSVPTATNSAFSATFPNVAGNSLQTGLSATNTVDLSPALNSSANPYDGDTDLTTKGWEGRWDRRSEADFSTNLGADLTTFLQGATSTSTVTHTTKEFRVVPCTYTNLFEPSNGICKTCGDNTYSSPITITLNDGNSVTVNSLNDIFECNGWTISFHTGLQQWLSFHSYIPHYYLSMRNYYYSGINNSNQYIYRHGLNALENNYQTFYGCTHPHIIDFISNDTPLNVNVYDTFHFITEATHYDSTTGTYVDDRFITFDNVYLYNNYQVTGKLQFNVKDTSISNMMQVSIQETALTCNLDRKERVWSFNNFRDMAIGRDTGIPLFTTSWTNLLSEPYLDKVINPSAVSSTKNWIERQLLRDKYLGIRLFFSNLAGQSDQGKHRLVTSYLYGYAQVNNR